MEMKLFTPENLEQQQLVEIIKTNKEKSKRKAALKKLRDITNRNEHPISTLQVKEYYDPIPNKPKYFQRFREANIFIFSKNSNISYNI